VRQCRGPPQPSGGPALHAPPPSPKALDTGIPVLGVHGGAMRAVVQRARFLLDAPISLFQQVMALSRQKPSEHAQDKRQGHQTPALSHSRMSTTVILGHWRHCEATPQCYPSRHARRRYLSTAGVHATIERNRGMGAFEVGLAKPPAPATHEARRPPLKTCHEAESRPQGQSISCALVLPQPARTRCSGRD
jgi:hypothetical protein